MAAPGSSAPAPLPETPDLYGAYPRLSEAQLGELERAGGRRSTAAGDVLFREGERVGDFLAILDGTVAMVTGSGTPDEKVVSVHGRGRFLGELGILTGQASFLTAVVQEPGEVLDVPVSRLKDVLGEDPALADLILRAYLVRRSQLIGLRAGLRIIGSRYSRDTRRLREFAARNRLPHAWIDVESDPEAEELLRQVGVSPSDTPVVIVRGQLVLRNPSNAELAAAIGLRDPASTEAVADLLVVGAGPAGLAAAVYGASEGLATLAFDGVATGGQAGRTSRIENYLGFPAGISGGELAERATMQAEKFGARISVPGEAVSLRREDGGYVVRLDSGEEVHARAVVVATGARYRRLPVPRLEDFEGISVHYAATEIEAQLCAGEPVAIVGGGNSAGQAAVFLSRRSSEVRLVVREPDLSISMSRYLIDHVENDPRIEVLLETEVQELVGEDRLEALVVRHHPTGERRTMPARALFVFIGAQPCTGWLGSEVALDHDGFVATGAHADRFADADCRELGRKALLLETSLPGVFAAGDVRSGSIKRVASAVGEGAMAVRLVHEHLSGRHTVDASGLRAGSPDASGERAQAATAFTA